MSERPPIPVIPLPSSAETKRGIGIDRSLLENIAVFAGGNVLLHLGLEAAGYDHSIDFPLRSSPHKAIIGQPFLDNEGQPAAYRTTPDATTQVLLSETDPFTKPRLPLIDKAYAVAKHIKPTDRVDVSAEVYGARRPVAVSLSDPSLIIWQNTESASEVSVLHHERAILIGDLSTPFVLHNADHAVEMAREANDIPFGQDTTPQTADYKTYLAMYEIAKAHGANSIGDLYAREPKNFAEYMEGIERGREVSVKITLPSSSSGESHHYTGPVFSHVEKSCTVMTQHYETQTAPLPVDITLPFVLPLLAFRFYRRHQRLKDPVTGRETGALVPSAKQLESVAAGTASLDDQLVVERYKRNQEQLQAAKPARKLSLSPKAQARQNEQLRGEGRKKIRWLLGVAVFGIAPGIAALGYELLDKNEPVATIQAPVIKLAPKTMLDQAQQHPCAPDDEVKEIFPRGK